AQSAADLSRALAEVTATAPPAAPTPAPARPAPVAAETNLTLEAVEVEGGPTVPVGTWTLVALTDPPQTMVPASGAARVNVTVPAGRYEVQVRVGTARITERFETTGARMTHRVVLNLGTLRPLGALGPGAPPRGGNWTVLADEVPGFRAGEPVLTSGAAEPAMRLVQGSYRLRFQAGEARAETDVFVPAGQTVAVRLELGAGEVTLNARRNGAPVPVQLWEVRRPGDPRAAASSGAAQPRLVLSAGEWLVRLRTGGAWHEQAITLAAGQAMEVTLAVP
ncbi:hypothetical protein, partial [Falsiroseomonas oryzae]|uniref:hypothetical protein n=1 Tax=Falsiroseomonas oryzae TaxID=2766473 RepID=UPI0022EB2DEE